MRSMHVVYVTPACAEFNGWGTRDLYADLKGRPPAFNTRSRRWVCQPATADELIALAESRGLLVTLEDHRPRPAPAALVAIATAVSSETTAVEDGLW